MAFPDVNKRHIKRPIVLCSNETLTVIQSASEGPLAGEESLKQRCRLQSSFAEQSNSTETEAG